MPFTRVPLTAQPYNPVQGPCCDQKNPAYNCNTIIGDENGTFGGAIINVPEFEKFHSLDSILKDNLQTANHIIFQGQVKGLSEIVAEQK